MESGVRLAQQLAAAVDATFLSRMLAEEPGWLEHHREPASSTSTSGGSSTGSGGASWARQLRLKLWLAGAAAAGSTLEADLRGWPPPPVTAPVTGSVLTLDWRLPEQRERALAVIAAGVNCSSGSSGSSGGLPGQTQPVLLKGAAAHWPAVQRWTLAGLAAAGLEGRARLAPSLQFPFTEPRLAALLAEQRGVRVQEKVDAEDGGCWELVGRHLSCTLFPSPLVCRPGGASQRGRPHERCRVCGAPGPRQPLQPATPGVWCCRRRRRWR